MILEHPFSTQINAIFSEKYMANSLETESFECRPFRLRCLFLMFLLLITSILRFNR